MEILRGVLAALFVSLSSLEKAFLNHITNPFLEKKSCKKPI